MLDVSPIRAGDPLTINRSTKILNENAVHVGTGQTFTVDSGGTFQVNGTLNAPSSFSLTTGQTSASLDAIGSTRGSLLERGASGWAIITPGTSGYVWTSNGSGADPSWQAAAGSHAVSLASDFSSVSTTTPANTNLTLTLPTGTWSVSFRGAYDTNSGTQGFQVAFAYSGATAVEEEAAYSYVNGPWITYQGSASISYLPLSSAGPVGNTGGTYQQGSLEGLATITVSGSSGTVTVQFSQHDSSATATKLLEGARLIATPVIPN
jgi:hypothetical protein